MMMMMMENNLKCGDFTLLIDFIRGLCPVVRPGPPPNIIGRGPP